MQNDAVDALPGRFEETIDALGVGVIVLDGDGAVQWANRKASDILSFERVWTLGDSVLDTPLKFVEIDGSPLSFDDLPVVRTMRDGTAQPARLVGVARPDGSTSWVLSSTEPVPEGDGRWGVVCAFVDMTAQQEVQSALRASEGRFRLLAENAADLIYRIGIRPELRAEYVNPALRALLGIEPEEWYASFDTVLEAIVPEDLPRDLFDPVDRERPEGHVLARMVHRDGHIVWMEHHLVAVRDPTGALVAVEGIGRDVTALKTAEAALSHRALHDSLTGLPNRVLLIERLENALASVGRDDSMLAVMYLDLDRFKAVNDNLGHGVGDRLLAAVARRLEGALRPSDSVARLGGDEFAAVLPDLHSDTEALHVAARVLSEVATPVDLGEGELVVTVSIGIVFAHDREASASELLRRADIAMYAAKDNGRAQVASYADFLPEIEGSHDADESRSAD